MEVSDNSLLKKNLLEALLNKDISSFQKLINEAAEKTELNLIAKYSNEIKGALNE